MSAEILDGSRALIREQPNTNISHRCVNYCLFRCMDCLLFLLNNNKSTDLMASESFQKTTHLNGRQLVLFPWSFVENVATDGSLVRIIGRIGLSVREQVESVFS